MAEFPTVTFILFVLNVSVFLFTYHNIYFFIDKYGFIPNKPRPLTSLTYMFLHAYPDHILGNMVMLLALGMVLESEIGWRNFLLLYFLSGLLAIPFEYLGRMIMGIPLDIPFIGSSGAIFGLFYLCAVLKPMEKVPTIMIVGMIVPLLLEIPPSIFKMLLDNPPFLTIFVFSVLVFIGTLLVFIPTLPVLLALMLYFVFWIILTVGGLTGKVSYFGHAGGMLGGILALFFFRKKRSM